MTIDTAQLMQDLKDVASNILDKDITTLRGFSERQLKAIAQQTELVTKGIISGEITEETRDFFLDSIEDMTLNFVKALRGMMLVTIEKVWNAMVGVIWKAIESATGLTLSTPN
jgi:hypothetical protein